ncbi:response regulator transcription factor [Alteribacter populi]|uniref:response regulator transcription factor n=1 Tax=Alteribacter populi TaxID=2011011 RepID=UPI000BBAE113|nr:response regulator transcription factor [Alteribacter populi]
MVQTLLIVDRNIELIEKMDDYFGRSGFQTYSCTDGLEAIKKIRVTKPDAIISELDLPRLSGLDLCRELRFEKNDWTPIIFTSTKNEELDAVLGLELGADDYMTKPLRLKELAARVKSTIRRGERCCINEEPIADHHFSNTIKIGEITIDPAHFLVYQNDQPVELTKKEFELLHFLSKNKGKAFSREQLLQELSDHHLEVRIIDVFISRIRRKIEPHRKNPTYVKTVRNIGYMMNEVT